MSWLAVGPVLLLLLAVLWPVPAPALPVDAPRAQPGSARRVLGYYVPYDPTSWASLQNNAQALDIIGAQWVTIDPCGNLASRDDQTLKQFARANGLRMFPSLLTLSGWLNHRLLTEEAVAARAIDQIVDYVMVEGYEGFDLDLEAVEADDRPAYTAFVAALGAALRERGKALALALPAKPRDVTTGWAGAYEYAALARHADLLTIMAYEYHGAWGGPGPIAPYDWVDQVLAFATAQIPAEQVVLGLAFYGYDWNTTSGGARSLGHSQAARLAERYHVPVALDPATRSATYRYQAPAGEPVPTAVPLPPLQHAITERAAPPCAVAGPTVTATATPRPTPLPGALQDHEVWLEESASTAARLELADRYQVGGIATWRLGHEDPRVWAVLQQWRSRGP